MTSCLTATFVIHGPVGTARYHNNRTYYIYDISNLKFEIRSNKNIFKVGDILYAKLRPNLNKVILADFDGICSTDILVLRPKDNINVGFYHSIFLSSWFNEEIMKGISGSQLPRTKYSHMSEIEVPNPDKSVQDFIYESIKKEKYYISSSNNLIGIHTKKIQDTLNQVWGI